MKKVHSEKMEKKDMNKKGKKGETKK